MLNKDLVKAKHKKPKESEDLTEFLTYFHDKMPDGTYESDDFMPNLEYAHEDEDDEDTNMIKEMRVALSLAIAKLKACWLKKT